VKKYSFKDGKGDHRGMGGKTMEQKGMRIKRVERALSQIGMSMRQVGYE